MVNIVTPTNNENVETLKHRHRYGCDYATGKQ